MAGSRVIVAGDRNETDAHFVEQAINAAQEAGILIDTLISGGARGVDTLAVQWAILHGVPYQEVNAEWSRYGRAAGPIRNVAMARQADALIAVHRDLRHSRGTANMIAEARRRHLRVFIYTGREAKSDPGVTTSA